MPTISETEREALEAGTVGWDAELFSGTPDWAKLRRVRPDHAHRRRSAPSSTGRPKSSAARSTTGASVTSCTTCPTTSGASSASNGFLGMLISKEHGGLGFSAQAQSLILGKISSRSPDGVTIVMVPNSLGPGELIEKYGTDAQKEHYPAAARAGRGDSLLRADRPVLGLRRRLHARHRRRHARAGTKARRRSASGSPGTSATSRSHRTRRCSASPSACSIPRTCSAAARISASRSR